MQERRVEIVLDEDEYRALINLVDIALWLFKKKALTDEQLCAILKKMKKEGEKSCKE